MSDAASPGQDCEQTVQQSGVDAQLASLRDQGGERFDAAGWHYLETLARHATAHEQSVRHLLEAKLERALALFGERFAQTRAAMAELVTTTCEKYPEAAAQLQRLFAGGDFNGLRRLRDTLEAETQCAGLATLVSRLELALAEVGHAPPHHAASRATATGSPIRELKTVRESRATWARMSVDRQVSLAMKQAPLNAGPINSHMLVLRSLTMMQEISPDYLSYLVSYVDTLRSLDPGEKDVPVKRKKATPAKAVKQMKAMKK